jgi:methylenetetrahydrofolate reductase (NADPH)
VNRPSPPARVGGDRAAQGLLARPVSLELAPGEVAGFAPDARVFPKGSRVFLSHIAGKSLPAQADAARTLVERGFRPVPHLGARNFDTEAAYIDHVGRLAAVGVEDALFVGGNPATSHGPLSEAADLLGHPVIADTAIRTAYLAVHPEGHPTVARPLLDAAFARKLELCAARGIRPAAVSQFGFDGEGLGRFATSFVAAHPGMELRLGLAGVTSLAKLVGFAVRCGVGPSLSILRKSPGALFSVASDRDPADVIAGIDAAGVPESADVHAHFFVFGGWKKTLAWLAERGGESGISRSDRS